MNDCQTQAKDTFQILTVSVLAALLTIASALVIRHTSLMGAWRVPVALIPAAATAWMFLVIFRSIRRRDEMHQRIQLEALAIAFMATALITIVVGWLQRIGAPAASWDLVWPVMAGAYIVGFLGASWRYR